jgi:hypothetical protein
MALWHSAEGALQFLDLAGQVGTRVVSNAVVFRFKHVHKFSDLRAGETTGIALVTVLILDDIEEVGIELRKIHALDVDKGLSIGFDEVVRSEGVHSGQFTDRVLNEAADGVMVSLFVDNKLSKFLLLLVYVVMEVTLSHDEVFVSDGVSSNIVLHFISEFAELGRSLPRVRALAYSGRSFKVHLVWSVESDHFLPEVFHQADR